MKLVFPQTAGALCAKMDRGLSGQDAVNGMVIVFAVSPFIDSGNIVRGGAQVRYSQGIINTRQILW